MRSAAAVLAALALISACSRSEGALSADPSGGPTPSGAASSLAPAATPTDGRESSVGATASEVASPTAGNSSPSTSPGATIPASPTAPASSGGPEPAPEAEAAPAPLGASIGSRVRRTLFGTHVGRIADGGQPLPPRAGAIRLWDAGVAWRELEPSPGRVNWSALDRAVARAESTGATDILWVHGSPPRWAARDPGSPGLYGPGTSSAPKKDAYLSILRRVAQRYEGRITSYQAWNEANLSIFYQGSPAYLAELTKQARAVLRKADPDALLVGASTTVRSKGPVKAWYGKYASALAKRGWPVDAMAIHLYPPADKGPDTRASYIRLMRQWLAARGWTGAVWDTEVNFGDRRDFAKEEVAINSRTGSAWVARTYLDSLALGVDRVYWYAWNDHILGIDQVSRRGAILPPGTAFLTVQKWLVGRTWQGCSGELMAPTGTKGQLTTCTLTDKEGARFQVLFTHRGSTKVERPAEVTRICTLDGGCRKATGARLTLGTAPVLLELGG